MIHRFEGYTIDTGKFEIRRGAQRIPTEPQVLELLVYLIDHRDRVVTRGELLEVLWSGRYVSDSALSSCVKSARKLVGDDGESQRCIRTIPRRGFRFVAAVETSARQSVATDAPPAGHYAADISAADRVGIAALKAARARMDIRDFVGASRACPGPRRHNAYVDRSGPGVTILDDQSRASDTPRNEPERAASRMYSPLR